jgi:hypothetical protein
MVRFQKGRGGQGGRGGREESNIDSITVKKKKTIEDYTFYIGSSKQAADYTTTMSYVVNHIKKEFIRGNDIAEALRTEAHPDMTIWEPLL